MQDERKPSAQKEFVDLLLDRQFSAAETLLKSGTDVNAPCNDQGWTPLHTMVEHYAYDAVVFLLRNGADPNKQDYAGITPLHLSVDIEADSASQRPPIHGKHPEPQIDITKLLLDYGALVDIKNSNGQSPLDWAERARHVGAINLLRPKEK